MVDTLRASTVHPQSIYANDQEPPSYYESINMDPPDQITSEPEEHVYEIISEQPLPTYTAAVQLPGNSVHVNKWPHRSIVHVCTKCEETVVTRLETTITIVTITAAILLFLFTFCLVWVPFYLSNCKRTTHYCPHCKTVLGERRELR